jgi:hypothetical protein
MVGSTWNAQYLLFRLNLIYGACNSKPHTIWAYRKGVTNADFSSPIKIGAADIQLLSHESQFLKLNLWDIVAQRNIRRNSSVKSVESISNKIRIGRKDCFKRKWKF